MGIGSTCSDQWPHGKRELHVIPESPQCLLTCTMTPLEAHSACSDSEKCSTYAYQHTKMEKRVKSSKYNNQDLKETAHSSSQNAVVTMVIGYVSSSEGKVLILHANGNGELRSTVQYDYTDECMYVCT